MYCTNCGVKLYNDARFCSNCGKERASLSTIDVTGNSNEQQDRKQLELEKAPESLRIGSFLIDHAIIVFFMLIPYNIRS